MKRNCVVVSLALLAGGMLAAQTTSTSAGANAGASVNQNGAQASGAGASSTLAEGTNIDATLTKSLDAKKAKPGDEVFAKANRDVKADGKVVIAKGSKLIGHVTEASARSKESAESKLGIVFDKAMSKGQEIPLHATIQAISNVQASAMAQSDDLGAGSAGNASAYGGSSAGAPGPRSNGGLVGGAANSVGGVGRTAASTVDQTARGAGNLGNEAGDVGRAAAGTTAGAAGSLNGTMHGVMGMPGVELNTAATGETASTLSSSTRNIHLESGTQMILTTSGSAK